MDQAKTNLPQLAKESKSSHNLWRIRTHLTGDMLASYDTTDHFLLSIASNSTGSLVHTQCPKGKRSYCYVDLYQFPHDANLTANILLQILKKHTPLPATLYLQFDNCFRENKNRYIFGVCALLIEIQVVKKVSYCTYKRIQDNPGKNCSIFATDKGQLSSSWPYSRRCGPDVFPNLWAFEETWSWINNW